MARLVEIDDALRCVYLAGMAGGLSSAFTVEECRSTLEGQWCAVTLKKGPFSLPAINVRRVDIDAAMRGAEPAVRVVRAVFAEHIVTPSGGVPVAPIRTPVFSAT